MAIDKAVKVFDKLLALDGEDLLAYQVQRRQDIFGYHAQYNPFYAKFLAHHGFWETGIIDWKKIPVMRKSDLQGDLQLRIATPYQNKKVFRNNTSGSNGTPFHFAKDLWCHALTWASYKYRFGQHGIDFNSSLQARFYGIPLKGLKYYKERLKDLVSTRVRFPVFNLNNETCAGFLQQFRKQKFVYLNGYTSSLVLFAKYCIAQGVVLKDVCPSLAACFTTSEVCDDIDRHIMETGFGIKMINEYGSAELDLLAVEDSEGRWVLNEETVYIEIVDEYGMAVPDGTAGRILVTGLYNQAFPMIRYELGDIGIIAPGERVRGRRILKSLEGRTNDVALLPSGRKVPGLTFYYVTKSLLEKGSTIREFVIRQEEPELFVLEYVADAAINEENKKQIQQLMDVYLEPGLQLSFEKVESINRTRVGKLRQFQSNIKLNVISTEVGN